MVQRVSAVAGLGNLEMGSPVDGLQAWLGDQHGNGLESSAFLGLPGCPQLAKQKPGTTASHSSSLPTLAWLAGRWLCGQTSNKQQATSDQR